MSTAQLGLVDLVISDRDGQMFSVWYIYMRNEVVSVEFIDSYRNYRVEQVAFKGGI